MLHFKYQQHYICKLLSITFKKVAYTHDSKWKGERSAFIRIEMLNGEVDVIGDLTSDVCTFFDNVRIGSIYNISKTPNILWGLNFNYATAIEIFSERKRLANLGHNG